MHELETEIKELIIASLMLEDISPAEIDSAAPLFVDGLGLDSIDALELGVAIRKKFGIAIDTVTEETRAHFFSVASLAAFIDQNRKP